MALTFPWALAYHEANERHQILKAIGDCYGVRGTVVMEDKSLAHLWWGQWILPLVLAVNGVLNYVWFRLYVKYGHPWRRLLTSDNDRIEEWKKLKLWEMLANQNNNGVSAVNGCNLNMWVTVRNAGRDVVANEDVIPHQKDYSSNRAEEFQEEKLRMADEVKEIKVNATFHGRNLDDYVINKEEVFEGEALTVRVDSSMVLDVYKCRDVLMERENIEFEMESGSGIRDEIHKQELEFHDQPKEEEVGEENNFFKGNLCQYEKDNDRTKVEGIIKENISMESEFCAEIICVDRDEDEELKGVERDKKEIDQENMCSVVYLWQGGDERDKENLVVKQNVSNKNDHCEEIMYVAGHHKNEIQTKNISLENNTGKEVTNNNKDKVMMGIKNSCMPGNFYLDLMDLDRDTDEEIHKDYVGEESHCRPQDKGIIVKENLSVSDYFAKELVGHDGDKEQEMHKANVELEHDYGELEGIIGEYNVTINGNYTVKLVDDDGEKIKDIHKENVESGENVRDNEDGIDKQNISVEDNLGRELEASNGNNKEKIYQDQMEQEANYREKREKIGRENLLEKNYVDVELIDNNRDKGYGIYVSLESGSSEGSLGVEYSHNDKDIEKQTQLSPAQHFSIEQEGGDRVKEEEFNTKNMSVKN